MRYSLPEVAQALPGLGRFCAAVKDLLERREGQRGPATDKAVIVEDLVAWGLPCSAAEVYGFEFIPALSMKLGGSHDPGLSALTGGILAYAFDAATDEELFFSLALPFGYREGAQIIPVARWAPSGTDTTGAAVWGLEYAWASEDVLFPAAQTALAISNPGGAANVHRAARFAPLAAPGKKIGSVLMGRVYRDANHASDGYAEDAFLLGLGFVVTLSSLGARTAFTK